MRGWLKPFEGSESEELHAEHGRRLFVKLARPNLGHQTDPDGFIRRRGGWLYGTSRGRDWAVPESAVVGIEET